MRRELVIAVLGLAAAGCQSSQPALLAPDLGRLPADALIAIAPLAAGENIQVRELQHKSSSSLSLVQIRDREQPHLHTRYDLTVLLAQGSGTLWLNGTPLPMHEGDVAFIPKGTPHYFVNDGAAPAAAFVVFAPPFSGPDQQPVP